jgi:hypothetical protein
MPQPLRSVKEITSPFRESTVVTTFYIVEEEIPTDSKTSKSLTIVRNSATIFPLSLTLFQVQYY